MENRNLLLLLSISLTLVSYVDASAETEELFRYAEQKSSGKAFSREEYPARLVRINVGALAGRSAVQCSALLPDNRRYDVVPDRIDWRGEDVFTWFGFFEGSDGEVLDAVISVRDSIAAGIIFGSAKEFRIVPLSQGFHRLSEVDPNNFFECGGGVPPDVTGSLREGILDFNNSYALETIDLLVVYTAEARMLAGGTEQIQLLIQNAVDFADQAYANSLVDQELKLVAVGENGYLESGKTSGLILDEIRASPAFQSLRDAYGADLVALVTASLEESVGGIAFLMSRYDLGQAFAPFAYSVSILNNLNWVMVHELGHNMGLNHDPACAGISPGDAVYPYAFGHKVEGSFRTLMAYPCRYCCPPIQYFSNPNFRYEGSRVGIRNERENWRALNNTASVVASFRSPARCPFLSQPRRLYYPGRTDSGNFRITWSPVTGAAMYSLQRSADFFSSDTSTIYIGTQPHFDEGTLSTGVYSYRVRAENCDYFSDWAMGDEIIVSGGKRADLEILVPASVEAGLGESFQYSVKITNLGPDQATGVTLTHEIPDGVTYSSCTPQICSLQDLDVVCDLGVLTSAQHYLIEFAFEAQALGTCSPSVSVVANEGDPILSNNTVSVPVRIKPVAELALLPFKTPQVIGVGRPVLMNFEVINSGPAAAHNVLLQLSLPEESSVISTDPACQVAEEVVCGLGILESDSSASQEVVLQLDAKGTFKSAVTVSADEFDPDEEDNKGDLEFVVTESAPLIFPYSLAVESPFPDDRYIGIALFNPNRVATDVEFIGLSMEGKELGRRMLSDLQGRVFVPPLGQSTMLTSEVFEENGMTAVVAQGTQCPVELFFMVGDYGLTSLDGVAGPLVENRNLYFPVACSNSETATVLFLFNSSPDQGIETTLKLRDKGGALVTETSINLPAHGSFYGEVGAIFEKEEVKGSVAVMSSGNVLGFELYSHGQGISALAAQPGLKATRLVAPHYFLTRGGDTELVLENVGQNYADVIVKIHRDDGSLVADHSFRLLRGERFARYIGQLLPVESRKSEVLSGYLVVELEGGPVGMFDSDAEVIGCVTFTAFDRTTIATLPLSRSSCRKSRFLHVAQSDELNMYTGMAILNLGPAPAVVTVRILDQTGELVAEKTLETLNPGSRVVDIMTGSTFFQTDFEQVGGHIEIASDQPVFSFALFGDYSGRFLSAIEGRSTRPGR